MQKAGKRRPFKKKCSSCGRYKLVTEFYRNRRVRPYADIRNYRPECKTCTTKKRRRQ